MSVKLLYLMFALLVAMVIALPQVADARGATVAAAMFLPALVEVLAGMRLHPLLNTIATHRTWLMIR